MNEFAEMLGLLDTYESDAASQFATFILHPVRWKAAELTQAKRLLAQQCRTQHTSEALLNTVGLDEIEFCLEDDKVVIDGIQIVRS